MFFLLHILRLEAISGCYESDHAITMPLYCRIFIPPILVHFHAAANTRYHQLTIALFMRSRTIEHLCPLQMDISYMAIFFSMPKAR